jgi:isopenicillin-N N-acyltransferase-like protein
MHGSAEPYVRLLQIRPRGTDREVLCLTLAGCLGMTGMNERGVAVTINNLSCMDAAKGVIWPAVVRAMLEQPSAARALVLLLEAPLMGGRHYMVADRRDVFGVEASASLKAVVHGGPGGGPYVHTNHCLDARMRAHERLLPETTTHRRRTLVMELIGAPKPFAADHLWKVLGSHEGYPRSICSHLDDESGDPSHSRTCAIIVMDPASGRVLFRRGCGQAGPPSELRVERRADAS